MGRTILTFVAAAGFSLCSVLNAQQSTTQSVPDIVTTLMPDEVPLSSLPLTAVPKQKAVKHLVDEQATAKGSRAEDIAYLLAVLGHRYPQNRDYLLHRLRLCSRPRGGEGCSEGVDELVISLYERGHTDVLPTILDVSLDNWSAAGSEALGTFMGELLTSKPGAFLQSIASRPEREQRKLCSLAGSQDGGGMAAPDLAKVSHSMRRTGTPLAARCLKEVDDANKETLNP